MSYILCTFSNATALFYRSARRENGHNMHFMMTPDFDREIIEFQWAPHCFMYIFVYSAFSQQRLFLKLIFRLHAKSFANCMMSTWLGRIRCGPVRFGSVRLTYCKLHNLQSKLLKQSWPIYRSEFNLCIANYKHSFRSDAQLNFHVLIYSEKKNRRIIEVNSNK